MLVSMGITYTQAQAYHKDGVQTGVDVLDYFQTWISTADKASETGYQRVFGNAKWGAIKSGNGELKVGEAPNGYYNSGVTSQGTPYFSGLVPGTSCIWWRLDSNSQWEPIAKIGDDWCFNALKPERVTVPPAVDRSLDVIQESTAPVATITKPVQVPENTTTDKCCCCDNKKPDIKNMPAEYSTEPEIRVEAWDQGTNNSPAIYNKPKGKGGKIAAYTFLGLLGGAGLGAGIWGLTKIKPRASTISSPVFSDPQPTIAVNSTGGIGDGWAGNNPADPNGPTGGGTDGGWGGGKWEGPKSLPTTSAQAPTSIMFTPPSAAVNTQTLEYEFLYKPQVGFVIGLNTTIGGGKFIKHMLPTAQITVR